MANKNICTVTLNPSTHCSWITSRELLMFFNESATEHVNQMDEIRHAQIDFINSNRVYAVMTTAFAAIFIYFLLKPQADIPLLTYWIYLVLLVDMFRMFVVVLYRIARNKNRVNYAATELHILIGIILSGMCWGGLALITIPVVGGQSLVVVLLTLAAISIGSTTTLSYQLKFTVIYILLILTPVLLSLPSQTYFSGSQLWLIEAGLVALILFLLKNAKMFNKSFTHMLELQAKTQRHEKELMVQTEKAKIANQTKSEFLANMSHELRTPMHAILGFSSIGSAKVGVATNEKISSYFSRINESGERLLVMLNDLLDLSKLEAGRMVFEFSDNDLQLTINNVVKELSPLLHSRSITVDVEQASLKTRMLYDNEKIAKVVQYLLLNAIKLTPDKMKVNIYFTEAKLYSNKNHAEENAISVSIQDQGPGLPDDELEQIFDEFVQSNKIKSSADGVGLGLLVSREIITSHGGVIKASNSIGEGGTVFTFTLPYQPMAAD